MVALPKPYYDCDGITIYHADCRDILPHLPKVDLVLTDPPYGLGTKMKGGTWGKADKYADMWNWDVLPSDETIQQIINISPHSVIWGGNNFILPPSRCWFVWDKQNAVHTVSDCELAWTNFDRPIKRFSGPVGIHDTGHPTQKPLKLIKWSILKAGDHDTILDPFMGSGTTLVAAKQLGRKAIGIEIELKYVEIAVKRLAQGVLPL